MTTSGGQDTADSEADPSTSGVLTSAGTLDGSGTSTGPSTTNATETTSDATGSSSGPDEESESSGGEPVPPGEGEPYGPCDRKGMCLDDNLCYQYQTFDMCLAPCGPGPAFECPEEPGGMAYSECIGAIGVYCMLNCVDGLECPEGTTCEQVFDGIFRCLWP